jgi:hypothetical protein
MRNARAACDGETSGDASFGTDAAGEADATVGRREEPSGTDTSRGGTPSSPPSPQLPAVATAIALCNTPASASSTLRRPEPASSASTGERERGGNDSDGSEPPAADDEGDGADGASSLTNTASLPTDAAPPAGAS